MHRNFVWNGGGIEGVSFHYVVDDKEYYHLVPDNEKAWHAGDGANGPGNSTALAIETCINRDGDWVKTQSNLVELVKLLMAKYVIPVSHVVQHNHWSGKDCPHNLRLHGWDDLVARFASNPPTDTYKFFPETGKTVAGDFYTYFKAHGGIEIFGYPITDEMTEGIWNGTALTVQYFERARFERHPDSVKLGLVGVEAHKAKYGF